MKKIVFALTAFILLLSLTSCLFVHFGGGDDSRAAEGDDEASSVTFNGSTIKLSYERNHLDLHYRENLTEIHSNTAGSYRNLSYEQNGEIAFEILLVYFLNKPIDAVMEGTDYILTDKTVNGLTYKYFEFEENDVPGHTYVYNFEGTTYTISFVSRYDTSSLETGFLSTVRFEHEE
ncbi:MAG: hypothetical protein II777_01295 [Clostridia bacterium]|nr:hypothetical protein [Clostridia bacterium]